LFKKNAQYSQERLVILPIKKNVFIWQNIIYRLKLFLSITFLFSKKYSELFLIYFPPLFLQSAKIVELTIIIHRLNHQFWIWYFLFTCLSNSKNQTFTSPIQWSWY
jgi:hypothetical protein